MIMKTTINQLLEFINYSNSTQLEHFADGDKKGIGATIAKRIKETQDELESQQFTSIEQISAIKGIGSDKITDMKAAIEKMNDRTPLIKSKTIFSFNGTTPAFENFKEQVKLVPTKLDTKDSDEKSYYLYYDKNLDKNQVFTHIKSSLGYSKSWQDEWFVIQGKDGHFLSADPTTSIVKFVSQIGINGNEYFKFSQNLNMHSNYDPYQQTGHGRDVQKYSFLYALLKCKADPNQTYQGSFSSLYIDYSNRELKYGIAANTTNHPHHFDIYGILGQPAWISGQNPFKSFNLMTYYHNQVLNPDQRVFISQEGTKLKGLVGNDIGWKPKNWFRYVDVIEDIAIKARYETGSHNKMHLAINPNDSVSFNHIHSWQSFPINTKFDMLVFYGHWGERNSIVTKVFFRSKSNHKFLSVDANDNVKCNSNTMGDNESFFIEQGWGTDIDDVVLKTYHGKYFYHYKSYAKADTITPISFEQMKIVIP